MPIVFKKYPYYYSQDKGVSFIKFNYEGCFNVNEKRRLFKANYVFDLVKTKNDFPTVKSYEKKARRYNIINMIKHYVRLYKDYESKFTSFIYRERGREILTQLEKLVKSNNLEGIINLVVEHVNANNHTIRPYLIQDLFLSISTLYYIVHNNKFDYNKPTDFIQKKEKNIISQIEYLKECKFILSEKKDKLHWNFPLSAPKDLYIGDEYEYFTINCMHCGLFILKYGVKYNQFKYHPKNKKPSGKNYRRELSGCGFVQQGNTKHENVIYKHSSVYILGTIDKIIADNGKTIYLCKKCYIKSQMKATHNHNYHTHHNHEHITNNYNKEEHHHYVNYYN